ncbi:DUF2788 domain-containing protein [Simiduia sp. 21SJ11W-1]|uniref:DUF2788 domain-containing protein n=1 Tax=Simiduia sp. 21SJ11W-1 TaxID=2909669 RepID=UPI0020A0905B|nr:DUF2788 domain-containing protein [Simiduia sp. 21SJ11W-1]UTA49560.1 DUF2788 domain-containing protein [Simiduia sp. 21SJ11W-1]
MDIETFETYSLYIGITLLIGFMGFIIWDLAKQSKAGRFGTIILFIVLGFCLLGFIIKGLLAQAIGGGS